ncbi:MAG: hypothetical protein EOP22_13710 [Hyphomicrobiales bacterium]|nr:MAG: hypothetical protein EOP22_13710 [Hyphomicrobiales bacterium]
MPSAIHGLFLEAMRQRRQIVCTYQGYRREICPILLGRTGLEEKALVFQFAGETSSGPVGTPDWKCFRLAEIENATLRDGPWHAGTEHSASQHCMKMVEYDVNPQSPYEPAFRL